MENKFEDTAKKFTAAMVTLTKNEERLENFEYYLSLHFDVWLKKFASTPEGITSELTDFANIEI